MGNYPAREREMQMVTKYFRSLSQRLWLIAFFALFLNCVLLPASATTLTVPADANIFGAGHSAPPAPGGAGAGELPTEFGLGFTAGSGIVLTFSSVTGSVTVDNG